MCGKKFGNFLFPLVMASLLANETPRLQFAATVQSTCPQRKAAISPAFE